MVRFYNPKFALFLTLVPDNVLQVAIMRKEFLFLETPSREQRNILINHFKDCIDFAGSCQYFIFTLSATPNP